MANLPIKQTMPWGEWWQEDEEVTVEVNVPRGTKPCNVQINFSKTLPSLMELVVHDRTIFSNQLLKPVKSAETVWSIRRMDWVLSIILLKSDYTADEKPWRTLFVGSAEKDGE